MANLLTTATLARWTQRDPVEVAQDGFAKDVIAKISALACFLGGHDGTKMDSLGDPILEWSMDGVGDTTTAPPDVLMVVLKVAVRSYTNPGQVIQEGSVGPLGGDRVADLQALFMDFSESERKALTRYNVDGDPNPDAGEVFTLPTTGGPESAMVAPVLFIGDDQQINLGDRDPWEIPMFNAGSPLTWG